MANKFVSFLETVGKDVEHVFTDFLTPSVVKGVENAVLTIDPGISSVFNLVANTAIVVEQKFAAVGKQAGTGPQKLAQVIGIVGSTIETFIANADVPAIVNAVVGFLNAMSPATATPAVASKAPTTAA